MLNANEINSISNLFSIVNSRNQINAKFKKDVKIQKNRFDREIDKIRSNKKFNFWMNSGIMKVSTIHSFKGWEIHSLFLIIDDDEMQFSNSTAELIYTGLTRCRRNLIIINCGNQIYNDFFQKYIKSSTRSNAAPAAPSKFTN